MIKTFDYVSAKLGNARTVYRKYYVHPLIMDLYESKELGTYLNDSSVKKQANEWSSEEMILLNILNTKKLPQGIVLFKGPIRSSITNKKALPCYNMVTLLKFNMKK